MAQCDWTVIYKKTNDWRWVQRIRQELIMINIEYLAKEKDYSGLKVEFDKNKAIKPEAEKPTIKMDERWLRSKIKK